MFKVNSSLQVSVLAVYMLANNNILLQEGITHDAVLYDQQFNEVRRQKGKPMHETWLQYEPNITLQRKTAMIVPEKYVTWLNSTETSAILDTNSLEAFPMEDLWKIENTSVSAMMVTASPDLSRYAGIGEYNSVQTLHVRARDSAGIAKTAVKRVDSLHQQSKILLARQRKDGVHDTLQRWQHAPDRWWTGHSRPQSKDYGC